MKTLTKSGMFLSVMFWLLLLGSQLAFAQAKCYKFGKEVPCEELKSFVGWGLGFIALSVIGGIAAFVFWILMLVHAATKPIENKAMWIIIMVLVGILGAFIYYFAVKRKFGKQIPPPTMTMP